MKTFLSFNNKEGMSKELAVAPGMDVAAGSFC